MEGTRVELTEETLSYLERVTPGTFAIYRLDGETVETLYVSPGLPALNGMTREEYLARGRENASAVAVPDDVSILLASVRRCLETGEPIDCNFRVFHKQLGIDWAHINAQVCGELDGCPVFLAIYTNASIEANIYQGILDQTNRKILVYDRHTHEILFANRAARAYGLTDNDSYFNDTCYRFLHGRETPCENCFMKRVEAGEDIDETAYEPLRGTWERITGSLTGWCGHDAYVQYIDDVTENVRAQDNREIILGAHEYQLRAMQALHAPGDIDERLNMALDEALSFFKADRVYIFEIDEGGETLSNTRERCREGIVPQIESLQRIDIHYMDRWAKIFGRHETLAVPDIEAIRESDPDEYAIMAPQDIRSYIEAPIFADDRLVGFIGADNPAPDRLNGTGELLLSFAYSVSNAVSRARLEEQAQNRARELENVLNYIPVGISMLRIKDGKPVSKVANPLLCDLYGIPFSEADQADQIAMERIPEKNRAEILHEMQKLLVPGTSIRTAFPYQRTAGGSPRWYRMDSRSLILEDELVYFSCLSDITAERDAETAQQQNRQMYEAAAQMANLSIWIYDIVKHRITMSDSGISKTDREMYSIPEVIENVPESTASWIADEDFEKVLDVYHAIENGAASASCEFWYQERPGVPRRCDRIFYMTVFDEDGKPVSAYGMGMNITAQKLEEEHYNSLYEQIAKANPYSLGTFHLNLSKNTCDNGQSPFESVLEQQRAGTVNGYLEANAQLIVDEDILRRYRREFTRENLLKAFRAGKHELSVEYPIRTSAGTILWIDGFVRMAQNPNTHDIEAVTYALDVTERKIEESITSHLTEDRYDHIGLIDSQKRTFELHKHGTTSDVLTIDGPADYEELCAAIAREYVLPADRAPFLRSTALESVIADMDAHGDCTVVFRCREADGRTSRKQAQFTWLDSFHRTILNTQTDVTAVYEQEQRQMQQLQEALAAAEAANEAKSDFLSRMSHDIRTPLNGIIGMTYLAREMNNSPQLSEYLRNIDTSSKFLLGLINDVLDMSKAESGKLELHPEPYDPREFFEYLNAVILPLCKEKNQRFVVDAQTVPDVAAIMDPLRINQVFFNLLSNAVKFTPEGGTITYRLRERLLDDGKLALEGSVIDTGIGISEEFQDVLFEPFTQENRNDISNARGTGLGLAIVKKIIDAMNGTIEVQSTMGRGTNITIRSVVDCIALDSTKVAAEKDRTCDDCSGDLSGKHILLCEDHPLNQEIAKTLLEQQGAMVTVADDGRRGIEAFSNSSIGFYDAILMDIRMPVMDGYEATRAIRSLDRPDAETVPIVAMTADAFADDVQKCLASGMNAHIAKPIDPQTMAATLRSCLRS